MISRAAQEQEERRNEMTSENVSAPNEKYEKDPKRKVSRLDSNALIQGLERIRECLEQRLVRLEAAARERPQPRNTERSELECELQERIHEYEEAQLRLRTQNERRDQEWRTALE